MDQVQRLVPAPNSGDDRVRVGGPEKGPSIGRTVAHRGLSSEVTSEPVPGAARGWQPVSALRYRHRQGNSPDGPPSDTVSGLCVARLARGDCPA
jgi:hypothetical protein